MHVLTETSVSSECFSVTDVMFVSLQIHQNGERMDKQIRNVMASVEAGGKKSGSNTKKKKSGILLFLFFLFHFSLFCFFVNQSILPSFPVSTCAHKKIVFSL